MKTKVIAIVGPTAVGKTDLSIAIAKRFQGEIISGDSMQIYKGMDIGTSKITEEEKEGIPHHMIDIKEPEESFSAAEFQHLVKGHIEDISGRGKLPIIVGGTGLYIQAALYNYNFAKEPRDESKTKHLEQQIEKFGITPFYQRLEKIDPEQAKKIHPNNHRRVIRALEIYETTGMTMTAYQKQQTLTTPYDFLLVGLDMDREILYNRINTRVDKMVDNGLVREVQSLYDNGLENTQAMKAIGYKEFIPYLKEEDTLEHSVELLKRNSRRYAKRQITWFKNKMPVTWYFIDPASIEEKFSSILDNIAGFIKDK